MGSTAAVRVAKEDLDDGIKIEDALLPPKNYASLGMGPLNRLTTTVAFVSISRRTGSKKASTLITTVVKMPNGNRRKLEGVRSTVVRHRAIFVTTDHVAEDASVVPKAAD